MAVSEHNAYANQTMRPKNMFLNKLLHLCLIFPLCTCNDTDGVILVSSGNNFALGFFSPGNSTYRYLGIWFNKIPKQNRIWVANRDRPIKNNWSGVLKINSQGNIVLLDKETNTTVWSTNLPITTGNSNSILKLLDSGNLVLTRNDSKNIVWQSFDYPTDSLLPVMKLGLRPRLGLNWSLTSWKSSDDPGNGKYSLVLESRGLPQFFLYRGSDRLWRSGPWNGQRLSSMPKPLPNLFTYRFVNTSDEIYLMFVAANNSIFSRLLLNDTGSIQQQVWNENNSRWNIFWSSSINRCESYAICGAYGSCGNNYWPIQCTCLPGFEPKFPQAWNLGTRSSGCIRKRPAQYCGKGEGFMKKSNVKVPDTSVARVDMNLTLEECKQECLRNCTCTAYTAANIGGKGSGCLAWYGDLIDIMEFESGGQDLFFRVDATELAGNTRKDLKGFHGKKKTLIIVLPFLIGALFLLVICGCCFVRKRRKGKVERGGAKERVSLFNFPSNTTRLYEPTSAMELEETTTSPELAFFGVNIILAATDNFSPTNKLGQGGFGPVYKGQLSNGQEIAIKRLSKSSGQGIEEFKNEVMLITKLQHRNLIKILGCCIHNEEKMLIYEYMPNKSLDYFIFDGTRRALLDWSNRAKIIVGIARGVLYLHQDSRLRIIHRDLKPSNILLDANMNPKISDFGTARIFGGDNTQENTRRVVGTYGYMSPEYAIDGLFSVKSDVFSFGVLLLEIISGKRSSGCYLEDIDVNLIAYVWRLWNEDIALHIVDSCLRDAYPPHEVLRYIQVGLLCVQESASDRPTMSNVIFMLANETNLPLPKQPAFVVNRTHHDANSAAGIGPACGSINNVTITTTEAR